MAQLNLSAPVPQHFMATRNRPQTAREIAADMDKAEYLVRSALTSYMRSGHILTDDSSPKRYYFRAESLAGETPRATSPKIGKLAAEFCRRWNCDVPYEATRKDPEALTEWTEMLAR